MFFLNLSKAKQLLQFYDLYETEIFAYPKHEGSVKLNSNEAYDYELNSLGIIGIEVNRNV